MDTRRDPVWLSQIERFGVKSLVKLVLAVFALVFFVTLVSLLPGMERLSELLPVSIPALVRTVVTLALVALLYRIATQASSLIRQFETHEEEFRDCVAAVVYWGVLLLAVVIAYEGFRDVGSYLFGQTGFSVFYSLVFVLMATIPLAFLLVQIGLLVHMRRQRTREANVMHRDVQTDQDRVLQLLEEHDGIIYQSEFVDATGWSKTKVSRILSEMESDGSINRYQIGREKVVCLPGHDPDFVT